MKANIVGENGTSVGSIELNPKIFDIKDSKSIYYAIKSEHANLRQGTAQTRDRSEVAYSGKKPWRQKGTGRARAGTRRSPIWVGGGTTFGPQMRDYSYHIPRKMKRHALFSVLSQKYQESKLLIIDDFELASVKTRDFLGAFSARVSEYQVSTNYLYIVARVDIRLKKSVRNIPNIKLRYCSQLVVKELYYADIVVLTKQSCEMLNIMGTPDSNRQDVKKDNSTMITSDTGQVR